MRFKESLPSDEQMYGAERAKKRREDAMKADIEANLPSIMIEPGMEATEVKQAFEVGADRDSAESLLAEMSAISKEEPATAKESAPEVVLDSVSENDEEEAFFKKGEEESKMNAELQQEIEDFGPVKTADLPMAERRITDAEKSSLAGEGAKLKAAYDAIHDNRQPIAVQGERIAAAGGTYAEMSSAELVSAEQNLKDKFGVDVEKLALGGWEATKLGLRGLFNKELRTAIADYRKLRDLAGDTTQRLAESKQDKSYWEKRGERSKSATKDSSGPMGIGRK